MTFNETEAIELKRNYNDTIEKEIVAFLNSHDGTIYIGVDDNGKVIGVNEIDKTLIDISDTITTRITPNPQQFISVRTTIEQDKQIIVIDVKKGNDLYCIKRYGLSAYGCYMRIGTTCRSMTEEQIKSGLYKYVERKETSLIDIPNYDQELTFDILKTHLITKGYHVNEKSFLKNYKLVTTDKKFNLLANLFADNNDVSMLFSRFEGTDKDKLIEKTEYGYKSIISSINRTIDRLEAMNVTKSVIGVPYRKDKRLIDMKCLRESFINSIAHNKWIDGHSPSINVFSDRIEIISHGGLPTDLTIEEFYLGISKPRNKELMRILSDLDYVEHTGYGIPKIIRTYGREVFEISNNFIKVILPFDKDVLLAAKKEKNDPLNDPLNEPVNDPVNKVVINNYTRNKKDAMSSHKFKEIKDLKRIKNSGTSEVENDPLNDPLNEPLKLILNTTRGLDKTHYEILSIINNNPLITFDEMSLMLNKSKATIKRSINELRNKGIIQRTGSKKNGKWIIK